MKKLLPFLLVAFLVIAWAGSASAIPFYADSVIDYYQGVQKDGNAIPDNRSDPSNALVPPMTNSFHLVFRRPRVARMGG